MFSNFVDVAVAGFAAISDLYESRVGNGVRRVRCDGPRGVYHGYLVGAEFKGGALITPNAAQTAENDAATAAAAALETKYAASLTIVRNQVARVRPIPFGSRTDQDRWLMALSFLLLKEE